MSTGSYGYGQIDISIRYLQIYATHVEGGIEASIPQLEFSTELTCPDWQIVEEVRSLVETRYGLDNCVYGIAWDGE